MALIKCPNCGNGVSSEATQCSHCKSALHPRNDLCQCSECQNTIRFDHWTCPYCGYKRSKIDFIDKAMTGCFLHSVSFVLWFFIAVVCFMAVFNALFG